jgi:BirA family biotin operon repressor/biotin-[acetyl-CoA-carboxylase] ligase
VLESDRKTLMLSSTSGTPSLNIPLLDRLRASGGDYVPLDELGREFEQVRSDLAALQAFGFGIERHPYRGAAYSGPAARLCPDQIEHNLATRRIGRRIAVWNRVTSTNDLAARAGTSLSNDGLVVLAEEQTAGRGSRGRSWTAPPCSSILMSLVLFPPRNLARAFSEAVACAWLTALGAVATAEVVTAWTGQNATIKWPNDVRIGGRKIAGILVERALAPDRPGVASTVETAALADWGAVIGIGLNVNLSSDAFPPELTARATSLQIEGGGTAIDRSELARDLIRRLDHWYEASRSHGCEILNIPWQARCEHLGRIVRITAQCGSICGRLIALDLRLGLTLSSRSEATGEWCNGIAPGLTRLPIAEILALEEQPSDPHNHEQASD